jgi:thymidylate synthase (FAD)
MTTISAELVALTQPTIRVGVSGPEALVAYIARLSNPENRTNPEYENLFSYCAKNKHWSIFQMVNAVVEIKAPRDITRQFTRHGSLFTIEGDVVREEKGFDTSQGGIQEFSQRYSDQIEFTDREIRRQDTKNRQNSIDDFSEEEKANFKGGVEATARELGVVYKSLLAIGAAKECARVILPEGLTMSNLCVNGTLRSWIHYLDVRDDEGVTQWEHVVLARKIKEVLLPAFPTIFGLLNGDT